MTRARGRPGIERSGPDLPRRSRWSAATSRRSTYSAQIADVVTAVWGPILQGKRPVSDLGVMAGDINKTIASSR
jgi:hypothetical protein